MYNICEDLLHTIFH